MWDYQLPPHPPSPPAATLPHTLSPLLPVWMNVSALIPWLLDFHTVQFSCTSGCWGFFLICYCSSSSCVRRQSVSTYTCILARSLIFLKYSFHIAIAISNFSTHPRELDLYTDTHGYTKTVIAQIFHRFFSQYFVDFDIPQFKLYSHKHYNRMYKCLIKYA